MNIGGFVPLAIKSMFPLFLLFPPCLLPPSPPFFFCYNVFSQAVLSEAARTKVLTGEVCSGHTQPFMLELHTLGAQRHDWVSRQNM